jgi:hypothetical protein
MSTSGLWRIGLIALLLVGCGEEKKGKLEGVWELVSARFTSPDTTIVTTPTEWKQVKVITRSHFAFVGQEPDRAMFHGKPTDAELLSAARTFFAGGGTYTLVGDTYTENIQFFFYPNYVGHSIAFKSQIEGDRWIMSGTYPAKSIGLEEHEMELYEVWKRIE